MAETLPLLKDRSEVADWSENYVPLARRGVSVDWLTKFVNAVQDSLCARPTGEQSAGYELGMADMVTPPILMNAHSLVERVIKPFTASLKAPLYAFVPDHALGPPDVFLSHPWAGLLVGPHDQKIGTIDALEQPLLAEKPEYAWIDMICYNQHLAESIALDMQDVVGKIGKIGFLCTPIPILGRSWCLWELLCSERSSALTTVYVRAGFRNDKILSVNALSRSFVGIEASKTTVKRDYKEICKAFIEAFGSFQAADAHVRKLIEERLSAPVYELHKRDEDLQFRPYPFLYDATKDQERGKKDNKRWPTFNPYYTRYLKSSLLFGSSERIFDYLIDAGLHVSPQEQDEHEDRTVAPAVLAGFRAAVAGSDLLFELLELQELDVNNSVYRDTHLLGVASQFGHTHMVERLLSLGAEIDAGPRTALMNAAVSDYPELVKLLLEKGADPNRKNSKGFRALHLAALVGHEEVVAALLTGGGEVSARSEDDSTPLLLAAEGGHLAVVRRLLDAGAAVDEINAYGSTALFIAAEGGHLDIVKELAANGANVHIIGSRHFATPLHLAAQDGHLEVVRWLLEAGVDPSAATKKGQTPLHLALRERNMQIANLLLDNGASTDCQDENGDTPLSIAQAMKCPETLLNRLRKGSSKKF